MTTDVEVRHDNDHDSIGDRCWYCGGRLIWQSDFNYGEVFGEGGGIVTYLKCMECGATVQYSLRDEDPDDEEGDGKDG